MAFVLSSTPMIPSTPSVDMESLLWEVRDLLRGLSQVNTTQAAQIAQLTSSSDVYDPVSAEYAERTRVALEAVDVALDQLQFPSSSSSHHGYDEESQFDDSRVRAWLYNNQLELENEDVETPASAVGSATPAAIDSADFWSTDRSFKWDEEPEVDSPLPSLVQLEPLVDDSVDDCDSVGPWDSVSVRDLGSGYDSDDDSLEDEQHPHTLSGGDHTTLLDVDMEAAAVGSKPTSPVSPSRKPLAFASPVVRNPFAARPAVLDGF